MLLLLERDPRLSLSHQVVQGVEKGILNIQYKQLDVAGNLRGFRISNRKMHVQHFYPPLFHSPRVFVAKFNILWLSCCGAGVGNSSMCATNKIFMDTNKHWYVCKHLWVVNCMKTSCVKAHQRAKNLRTSSSSRSKDVKKAWIHHFLYCRLYRNIRCWQTVTLPKA